MHIETKYNIMQKNKEKKFMEKNEIKGLTKKEVEEKIKLGNVNTTSKNIYYKKVCSYNSCICIKK